MLWRRSPQALLIPPSAPVPDAEALRRAALQASWRRDRWVARRRVWLRWLLWISGRYLMPALLVFGLGAWLWLGVWPGLGYPVERPHATQELATPPTPPAAFAVAVPAPSAEPAMPAFSPEGEELPSPLALKFETRWATAANDNTRPATAPPAPDTLTPPSPRLKPENWLHSKEP